MTFQEAGLFQVSSMCKLMQVVNVYRVTMFLPTFLVSSSIPDLALQILSRPLVGRD